MLTSDMLINIDLAHHAAIVATTTPAAVVVPGGVWLNQILLLLAQYAPAIVGGLLVLVLRKVNVQLGGDLKTFLKQKQVNEILTNAIEAAFGLVEGAVKQQKLTLPITNSVLQQAAQYVINVAPKLVEEVGENLGPMIIARLSAMGVLPDDSSASSLVLKPSTIPPVPSKPAASPTARLEAVAARSKIEEEKP